MASTKPSSGESTIAARVFDSPLQTTTATPALAIPAPSRPPISAWELLDGMPKNHVTRFQTMAPVSAPNTTRASTICASTMPVPSVCATCRPNTRKAMKLKNAAQATACCGRSTRVDTMVATEFAASWNPLRKSNPSAMTTSPISTGRLTTAASMVGSGALDVLDDGAVDHVADVVEAVDDLLEVVVHLVAGEESHRIGAAVLLVELLEPAIVELVGLPLDPADFLGDLAQMRGLRGDRAHARHRLVHEHGAFLDGVAHRLHLRRERSHVEHHDGFRGLLHLIDGIVHRGDEVLDIAAIERGDEGAADGDEHVPGDVVGVLLAVHDDLVIVRNRVAAVEHRTQGIGAGDHALGMLREQVEEALLPRQQCLKPFRHARSPFGPAAFRVI